jgi:2',3'-cyclic-nucleotide 2'-phosphodiesterase (5'-nucleotidase family)
MKFPDWSRQTVLALLFLIALTPAANAQLETLETENLRVIYIAPLHSYLAPYAARCFENSLAFPSSPTSPTSEMRARVRFRAAAWHSPSPP